MKTLLRITLAALFVAALTSIVWAQDRCDNGAPIPAMNVNCIGCMDGQGHVDGCEGCHNSWTLGNAQFSTYWCTWLCDGCSYLSNRPAWVEQQKRRWRENPDGLTDAGREFKSFLLSVVEGKKHGLDIFARPVFVTPEVAQAALKTHADKEYQNSQRPCGKKVIDYLLASRALRESKPTVIAEIRVPDYLRERRR